MNKDNTRAGTQSRMHFLDLQESYGRHILSHVLKKVPSINHCLDIGCGMGQDLTQVQHFFPQSHLYGIDCHSENQPVLASKNITFFEQDIEKDILPFESDSVDFIIANQILEHCKEIFWINHEIFRSLAVGGYAFIGVPNTLSFHNRLLALFGIHPTNIKMISAHVRGYSKRDVYLFYNSILKGKAQITNFYGSQFYPFPKFISRPLSFLFPSMAVSNFFLIQKTAPYENDFVDWLNETNLETNFFKG